MTRHEAALKALARQLESELNAKAAEVASAAAEHARLELDAGAAQRYSEQLRDEVRRLMISAALNPALIAAVAQRLQAAGAREGELRKHERDSADREARLRDELASLRHRGRHIERAVEDAAHERLRAVEHKHSAQLDDLWLAQHAGGAS